MTQLSYEGLKDKLTVGLQSDITKAMYEMLHTLHRHPAPTQLQAVAVMFHLLAEHYGLNVREVMQIGENVLRYADKTDNEQVKAFRMYMKEELK